MADLQCYVTTFNCGRSLVDVAYFAKCLFHGPKGDTAALPPDLIVLSLQEIAPLAYSFLGGSFLVPYFARLQTAVQHATKSRFEDAVYETVLARNVGMTAIMVFARSEVASRIEGIKTAGVGCGFWDMGNKGAVGVRMTVADENDEEKSMLTFVAAHLAPMEDACQRRNEDWRAINEGLVFQVTASKAQKSASRPEGVPLMSGETDDSEDQNRENGLFVSSSHVFFAGDLNYRTSDVKPELDDYVNWPQPTTNISDAHHYSKLFAKDQLTRELRDKRTLHHLTEAPVNFPPTYKYSTAAQKQAAQRAGDFSMKDVDPPAAVKTDDDDDQVWMWAKHRVPSWCDRVMYLPQSHLKVHSYTALALQPTSDHRPVTLSFTLPWSKGPETPSPPFKIKPGWESRRATARRFEILVGLAMYLTWTWEGEALLAGTIIGIVGGSLIIKALVG